MRRRNPLAKEPGEHTEDVKILLSDISEGMLRDARRALGTEDKRFDFQVMDCQQIPVRMKA